MIKLKAQTGSPKSASVDMIACIVFEDAAIFGRQKRELAKLLKDVSAIEHAGFEGKNKESLVLFPKGLRSKKFLLVGGGRVEDLTAEKLRRVSATTANLAEANKARTLAIAEPDGAAIAKAALISGEDDWSTVFLSLYEGAFLGSYRYDKYFTGSNKKKQHLREFSILHPNKKQLKTSTAMSKHAAKVCEATCFARDLENGPGNEIFPETLAQHALDTGEKHGFSVSVLDEAEIQDLKMGGLLGVAQGSNKPPRFIIMEYAPNAENVPTVVLVGKGVTFDAGGISIKPAANMAEMKMDMSGAAAVIGTLKAVASLKLPVKLIGLVPATENLLGGSALKPGDVLTHLNGKTSEVDNTDAEGRLILADALSYADRYNPDIIIDLATLTGACVVALGHHATGMMGNDQPTMDKLLASGDRTYERVWQLPLFKEYESQIKSDIADVKNVGGRWAGAITAALFLKHFVGDRKWVHLDIAGTAIMEEASEYVPKGGSGVGVRLLTDFLARL